MTIFTQYDADKDTYELWCSDGRMSATPVGPRIFRSPPHPVVAFSHGTAQEAESDAAKIRTYLASLPQRQPTKKEVRQAGA